MLYKKFPKSDFKISVLGFGTAPVGLSGYQDSNYNSIQNELQSIETMEKAIELGINFFDTAPVYGNKISENRWSKDRLSEKMLGKVINNYSKRESLFIATKNEREMNKPKDIIDSLEESLNLLQTNYVDLFQLHGTSYRSETMGDLINDETISILKNFQKQGKVKYIGLSGYRESAFCNVIERYDLDAIMPQYNIFYRSAEWELLDLADKNSVAIFPMRPASGREIETLFSSIPNYRELNINPYKIAIEYVLSKKGIT